MGLRVPHRRGLHRELLYGPHYTGVGYHLGQVQADAEGTCRLGMYTITLLYSYIPSTYVYDSQVRIHTHYYYFFVYIRSISILANTNISIFITYTCM